MTSEGSRSKREPAAREAIGTAEGVLEDASRTPRQADQGAAPGKSPRSKRDSRGESRDDAMSGGERQKTLTIVGPLRDLKTRPARHPKTHDPGEEFDGEAVERHGSDPVPPKRNSVDWRILRAAFRRRRSLREISRNCGLTLVGTALRVHRLARLGLLTRTKKVWMAGNDARMIDLYEHDPEAHEEIDSTTSLGDMDHVHPDREDADGGEAPVITPQDCVLGACFVSKCGELLGSSRLKDHLTVDEDLFAGMVVSINDVLKVSLRWPDLRLVTLDLGHFKLLVEPGRYCHLVVLTDEESGWHLRTRMQHVVREFEETNLRGLERWSGDTGTLHGIRRILRSLVANEESDAVSRRVHGSRRHKRPSFGRSGVLSSPS